MNEPYQNETPAAYTPMSAQQVIQVAVFGLITGLVVWGLTFVFSTYMLSPLLCQNDVEGICSAALTYGEVIATIIGAAVGLFILVRLQVFRPLLVVLAAVISLWGLIGIVSPLPWYVVGLCSGASYMLVYLLFTWITRIRLFWIVVVLLLALIFSIRLILTA